MIYLKLFAKFYNSKKNLWKLKLEKNFKWHFLLSVDEVASAVAGASEVGPPKFLTQVASKIEISEGQSAHFEARLTPTEDANLKVF